MKTVFTIATIIVLTLSMPMQKGIDIHAAIFQVFSSLFLIFYNSKQLFSFQSEDKVSSGGYLTNKFTSLLFTPTIHNINQKLEELTDSVQDTIQQDFYQNIFASVAAIIVSVALVFLIKKLRSFRKKMKITT